jgi:single-stranded-DNA-specific exonuclease
MKHAVKRWIIAPPPAAADQLVAALGVSPFLANLLTQRGCLTPEQAEAFLEPRLQALADPFQIRNLHAAAERLVQAVQRRERIAIYGDYDVDGITSSTLLWRVLRALGAEVTTFLPHRVEEGYGLSRDGLERCLAECHPNLLVAVDCGTTSAGEIRWLQEQGMEAIVVDHHTLPDDRPPCLLVNPQQDDDFRYLASVGLVFKLCHGILKVSGTERDKVDLRDYLDLVAVGTVADLVPLCGDNRILVRRGLQELEHSRNPGLQALYQVAGLKGRPTTSDVGFRLGPRLNASGRLGDAMQSLRLLTTDDPAEARQIAAALDVHNRERQQVEQAIADEALALLEATFDPEKDWAIVLGQKGWHIGVIGIVASRLQRAYHRPTIVVGFDEEGYGKGSGRSIEGCSLVKGLRAHETMLLGCGGHDMAAGLSIREEQFPLFREKFNQWVRTELQPEHLQPKLKLAGELSVADVTTELFQDLERLAPFGQQNPEPLFAFRGIEFAREPKKFGKNHVKFFLKRGRGECEAVGFGLAEKPRPAGNFVLAGAVDWDDYRNQVQIRLLDWQDRNDAD